MDAPNTSPPAWLLVAALEPELRPVLRRLRGSVSSAVLGLGARRAGESMRRLLAERRPRRVLLVGLSGALTPDLKVGDVVAGRSAVNEQGEMWELSAPRDLRQGRLLTVGQVVGEPAKKAALSRRFDALAVDMESAAVAQACREARTPLTILRAISDAVDDMLPADLGGLIQPDGRASVKMAMMYLLRRPHRLPLLLRLGRATRRAGERLGEAAAKVVGESSG